MKRLLFALLAAIIFVLSGCGGGGSSSTGTTTSETSAVTYSGTDVTVKTDSSGKATIVSSTLGVSYEILVVDSYGNSVSSVDIDYSEDDGRSIIYIADTGSLYSDTILIGTPAELANTSPRGKLAAKNLPYNLGLTLISQSASTVGFTSNALDLDKVYLSHSARKGWYSGFHTNVTLATKLITYETAKDIVIAFAGDVTDTSVQYLKLKGSWWSNPNFLLDLNNRIKAVYSMDDTAIESTWFSLTCYKQTSGPIYDNGIGSVCEIRNPATRVLTKTGQTNCWDENGNILIAAVCLLSGTDGAYQVGSDPDFSRSELEEGEFVVTDNLNGLMWQDEASVASLTDNWDDAHMYCDNLTIGDYADWRLPTVEELESIVDYGHSFTAINSIFINTDDTNFYWSSSVFAFNNTEAWVVGFGDGVTGINPKGNDFYIRCVRNNTPATVNLVRDNSKNTVTDKRTGLMWQDNVISSKMLWKDAIIYCEDETLGGYSDWRLPNVRELISITDKNTYNPSIDAIFLNNISETYWSSSTYVGNTIYDWGVNFNYGYATAELKSSSAYARCVRGGQ